MFLYASEDFVRALQLLDKYYALDDEPAIADDESELLDTFGLSYDCHGFKGVYSYALSAVRGTLAAVDSLIDSQCKVIHGIFFIYLLILYCCFLSPLRSGYSSPSGLLMLMFKRKLLTILHYFSISKKN